MKALIQRVMKASVAVDGEIVTSIDKGICVFIGITHSDTEKDMQYIIRKILDAKIFNDEEDKKWKKTVVDKQLEILSVSQYTLYHTWKGTKPDFHKAMPGESSKELYATFLQALRDAYVPEKVKDGLFGIYKQIIIQNDGPVTLEIESPASLQEKTRKNNKLSN